MVRRVTVEWKTCAKELIVINIFLRMNNDLLPNGLMPLPLTMLCRLALLITVGVVLQLSACQSSSKIEAPEKEDLRRERKAVVDLVAKHQAVVLDWQGIPPHTDRSLYSIEVKEQMLRTDSRPIVFTAILHDIDQRDGKYIVRFLKKSHFVSPTSASFLKTPRIMFLLDSSAEQIQQFLHQSTTLWDQYAVVASISSIQKALFGVGAVPLTADDAEVVVQPAEVFIAHGRCLEAFFVGDYDLEDDQNEPGISDEN